MQKAASFLRTRALRSIALRAFTCLAFVLSCVVAVRAQSPVPAMNASAALPDAPEPQPADSNVPAQVSPVKVIDTPGIFLQDQVAIWTSPVRLRPHDLKWIVPVALATGAAIVTDNRVMVTVVSHDPSFNNTSINVSNGLVGGFIATPLALFAAGQIRHDEHARETGILGSEALADGFVVSQVIKLVSWRVRPSIEKARGQFFQSSAGIDGSFFSMHTTLAFSAASAIASEYHSPWLHIAAYSGASAVGITRILGQEHFPSDVLVGATTGWLIGHYVVKHHRRAQH